MGQVIHCDRCGISELDINKVLKDVRYNRPKHEFKRLDYWSSGIGHYYSVYLCDFCGKDFSTLFLEEDVPQWELSVEGNGTSSPKLLASNSRTGKKRP